MNFSEGCGGRLCRALRWYSVKFDGTRYAEDDFGGIDKRHMLLTYKVCGKICSKISGGSSSHTDIPGRYNSSYSVLSELLVICSSADIEEGDVIFSGRDYYRIAERTSDNPLRFSLEKLSDDFGDDVKE